MARKPTDPAHQALAAWDKRYATLKSSGVDTRQFDPIMQQDLDRVRQGRAGMTDIQARAVVQGMLSGKAPTAQHRPSGIMDVVSNIVPDVANTITGLITGIPKFVYHLPSEVTHTAQEVAHSSDDRWLKAHGFEGQNTGSLASDIASAFRNTAKTPVLSLVPGLADIAGLTSGQGRESLRQHPVQAALDIAPVGEAATGFAAHAGLLGDVGEAGSAAEAAAAGHPLRAAYRALPDALTGPVDARVQAFREATHTTAHDFRLARASATEHRAVTRAFNTFTHHFNRAWSKLSPEEQDLATRAATLPADQVGELPANVAHVVELSRQISNALGDAVDQTGELVPVMHNGQRELYPRNSAVPSTLRRVKAGQDALAELRDRTTTQIDRTVEQAQRRLTRDLQRAERQFDVLNARKARLQAAAEHHTFQTRRFEGSGTGELNKRYGRLARDAGRKVDTIDKEIASVRSTISDLSEQRDRVPTDHPRVKQLRDRLDSVVKEQHKRQAAFERTFAQVAPARYHPALERALVARAQQTLEGQGIAGPELEIAMDRLQRGDPNGYFSPRDWADLKREVQGTWQTLSAQGFHPVWMQNVEDHGIDRALASKPLAERPTSVAAIKNRVFDLKPRVDNLAVGLTKPAVEILNRQASIRLITEHIQPYAIPLTEALDRVHELADAQGWTPQQFRAYVRDNFRMFDPETLITGDAPPAAAGSLAEAGNADAMVVPRDLAEAAHALLRTPPPAGKITQVMRRTTALNKYAVMSLSVKHMIHVQLGGLVQLLGRSGIEEFAPARWVDAIRQVREGRQEIGLANAEDRWTPDQQLGLVHGHVLGRLWAKTGGELADRIRAFDEFTANVQRVVAYTSEYDRQLKRGFDDIEAKQAALNHAHKTLVSIDDMSPLEQTIVRQVFPFYAFTRHILRYVLTYPMDYPLRAAILARMVSIENTQNNSLLPEQFRMLFFLGHPDPQGNIKSVDIRGLNPFRDVATNMTLTGFVRGLNPIYRVGAEAVGINTLTGAPSPYQNITYDPVQGRLVATRPSHGLVGIAEKEIPQFGLLDHYIGLTKQMRDLKATNPAAYKSQVYNLFFVPTFGTQNIPQVESRAILDQLRVAQNAESAAMQGDTSQLSRFDTVPFQGQFVPTDYIRQLVAQLQAAAPGFAPKAVMQTPKRKKNKTGF